MHTPKNKQNSQGSKRKTPPTLVKTISKTIDSTLEPVELFAGLCDSSGLRDNMLLESSEIESKENVKSILLIKSALRIICNEHQVTLEALSANGLNALEVIALASGRLDGVISQRANQNQLNLSFEIDATQLDEDSRLKRLSPIDALRITAQSLHADSDNEYAIFLCGLFAFDFIATFEALPPVDQGDNDCPDFVFYLAETLLVIDHKRNQKRLISNHFSGINARSTYFQLAREFEQIEQIICNLSLTSSMQAGDCAQSIAEKTLDQVTCDLDDQAYRKLVEKLKQNIIQGDIFQVVPSRTFSLPCINPLESYRQLKQDNPSPYLFYMQDRDFTLFGASPESALKYTAKDNQVLLYPIAGTRVRGKLANGEVDLDLDARLEAELKLDQKEIAEHFMLVDLARNDIARISRAGTTQVPRLLAVDRYSQVMHLVSCVQGQLRPDLDALHAYQACMNMGTLTGAPKIRATELIRQAEGKRRGSYGGAVGYIDGQGDMDTCIVIRSAFYKNGVAHIQAGAGVVFDSHPQSEADETRSKARAVINAVLKANRLSLDSGSVSKAALDSVSSGKYDCQNSARQNSIQNQSGENR